MISKKTSDMQRDISIVRQSKSEAMEEASKIVENDKRQMKKIIKVGTKVFDGRDVKTISRLFTIAFDSIPDETKNRGEEVFVEFEGWGGDNSLSRIKRTCAIIEY